jgi:hypothetical protein
VSFPAFVTHEGVTIFTKEPGMTSIRAITARDLGSLLQLNKITKSAPCVFFRKVFDAVVWQCVLRLAARAVNEPIPDVFFQTTIAEGVKTW